MSWWTDPVRAGVVVAVVGTLGFIWYLEGRDDWRSHLEKRFIFGVPWGTLISVVGVVAFYLIAQSGLTHWSDPVIHPFRSWAYTYPLGMLAAGFAHAGPNHLLGNMMGTVVLSPIVEYAWGHYPPGQRQSDAAGEPAQYFSYPPPGGHPSADSETGESTPETADGGWLATPWIRAFVLYPGAIVVVSLLTSLFALGWSLGFSGTVFVFVGFAVIRYPLTTIVSMVVFSGVSVIMSALRDPILVETADPGGPSPPSWAGVNVQAHLLGFLLGVVIALWLLSYRNERTNRERVAFAVILIVLVRSLWALALGGDDVYRLYRGYGVIFVLALSAFIIAILATEDIPLPKPSASRRFVPSYRTVSLLWLGAVGAFGALVLVAEGTDPPVVAGVVAVGLLVSFPALPAILPEPVVGERLTRRDVMVGLFLFFTVLVMLVSVPFNIPDMAADPVPEGEAVEIEDYTITYAENASHGRIDSEDSGVIVVSEEREIWSSVVDKDQLAHSGSETIVVGGVGWRESVEANRTGWEVAGNDSVYVVDLEYDGERVRSFTGDPVQVQSRIANQTISVVPAADGFRLNVSRDGTPVGEVPIPAMNETVTIDSLQFSTEDVDDTTSVFAEQDGTRVLVAERETYD
jgi:membrane associated rhomboid family serine protease